MKNWFNYVFLFFKKRQKKDLRPRMKPPSDWTPRDVTPVNYLD
jgi:hypothetical protein